MLYITITMISIYIYTLSVTKGAFVTVRSILSSAEPMLSTFTKHLYFNAMNPIWMKYPNITNKNKILPYKSNKANEISFIKG